MKLPKRKFIQLFFALLANANIGFLWQKALYRGPFKGICFPGLNCYSCPAASFACPLGTLQQALASLRLLGSQAVAALAYVAGSLVLFGLFLGRIVCGWICPFGLLQELLYKIKTQKFACPRVLFAVKYFLLVFFVILLPALLVSKTGYGKVWFCRLICPAGTFEAGLLNLALRPELAALVKSLFYWKVALLLTILTLCVFYFRFFCKVLCPLGLIYGLFNKVGFFKLKWHEKACLDCDICEKVCPMGLKIPEELNSVECIRCLNCLKGCPAKVIELEFSSILTERFDSRKSIGKKRYKIFQKKI
ncbi:4Fe-4S binding protein [Thermodesulfatator indicus]